MVFPGDFLYWFRTAGTLDEADVTRFLGVVLNSTFVEDANESLFDESMTSTDVVTGHLRAVGCVTDEGVPVGELQFAVFARADETGTGLETFFETVDLGGAAESHLKAPCLGGAFEGGIADDVGRTWLAVEIAVTGEGLGEFLLGFILLVLDEVDVVLGDGEGFDALL